jgi:hypothetical protein
LLVVLKNDKGAAIATMHQNWRKLNLHSEKGVLIQGERQLAALSELNSKHCALSA